MPKFTIEIDTDNKTCVKSVNGVPFDIDSMSLSQWSYTDDDKKIYEYSVSVSKDYEGERVSQSYSWSVKEGQEEEPEMEYSKTVSSCEDANQLRATIYINNQKLANLNKNNKEK